MIIELITGVIKSIVSQPAAQETPSMYAGAGIVAFGGLFIWIFIIAILIKAGLSAFKDTEAERMNPVENVQSIFEQKRKQQQHRQRAIEKANFKPDRINK